jgi:predicted PurR-regulated permease PerM
MNKFFDKIAKKIEEFRKDLESKSDTMNLSEKNSNVDPKNTDKTEDSVSIDMSVRSAAKAGIAVILVIILFQFIYDIGYILVLFFVAFLLAAALDPLIDRFYKYKIPRALSVLLVFFVLFISLGLFISDVVKIIGEQFRDIAANIGKLIQNINENGDTSIPFNDFLKPYIDQIYEAVDFQSAASQVQNAFSLISIQLVSLSIGLFNLLIVLVLTFFMTVEEASIEKFYMSLFPSKYGKYVSTKMKAVKQQIGLWIRGQLMVSLVAAILSYIALALLGVDYALTLSIIAGLAMIIPVVGRVFAWVITVPIVFSQSPALAVWISLIYLLIQQLENNILVPLIMKKAVGLSPIIIIFAMMVGNHYLQWLGLIISVPIATTVALFVRDYTAKEK